MIAGTQQGFLSVYAVMIIAPYLELLVIPLIYLLREMWGCTILSKVIQHFYSVITI